jgi:hypothetical protein
VSHNQAMEPFTFVVVGAVVLFVLVGLGSFLAGGSLYDKIGEGGLSADGPGAAGGPPANSALARAEREMEIRQMLQARSDRQVKRGGEALDIEAELALLEEPGDGRGGHDPGLAEEVRQLVMARNERRVRSGEEPMDVEEEVQRTLAELDPEGA